MPPDSDVVSAYHLLNYYSGAVFFGFSICSVVLAHLARWVGQPPRRHNRRRLLVVCLWILLVLSVMVVVYPLPHTPTYAYRALFGRTLIIILELIILRLVLFDEVPLPTSRWAEIVRNAPKGEDPDPDPETPDKAT
jgi:MFS family permease